MTRLVKAIIRTSRTVSKYNFTVKQPLKPGTPMSYRNKTIFGI